MKNYEFLFWAYNVVWIAFLAFVIGLFLRMRSIDRRLQDTERRLDRKDA